MGNIKNALNRANRELDNAITALGKAKALGALANRQETASLDPDKLAVIKQLTDLIVSSVQTEKVDIAAKYKGLSGVDLYSLFNGAVLAGDTQLAEDMYLTAQSRRIESGTTEIECEWLRAVVVEGREHFDIEHPEDNQL